MKVTIGTLFKTYQIADRIRRETAEKAAINSNVNSDEKIGYGLALLASLETEEALKNCELEIELSPKAITILVPFSQDVILSALSNEK